MLEIVTVRIIQCNARLAVEVTQIALNAVSTLLDIFQLNYNGKGMRTLPCMSEMCSGARKNSANLVCRQKSSTQ